MWRLEVPGGERLLGAVGVELSHGMARCSISTAISGEFLSRVDSRYAHALVERGLLGAC